MYTILDQIHAFSSRFGAEIQLSGVTWRYYRLGSGPAILWLTGGLRRAALAFPALELLSRRHTLIAPDYPPVRTIREFNTAFDAMLAAAALDKVILVGQSYGGMLAQAYILHRPQAVERLVLSSSGPANFGKGWLPAEYLLMGLTRLLPEVRAKDLLYGNLLRKIATLPGEQHRAWQDALFHVMRSELSRADILSHFGVAADLIRQGSVHPGAYRDWAGQVIVLSAANDPTQSPKDFPRYEQLFGRPVQVISLGDMGHTAVLFDPARFVDLLETAIAGMGAQV